MKIIIPGVPVGKGRPKFSTVKGHAIAYTPAKTASYENLVKIAFQNSGQSAFDREAQLKAEIKAFFPIPKSTSKRNIFDVTMDGSVFRRDTTALQIADDVVG